MTFKEAILQALSIGPVLERFLDNIKEDIFNSIVSAFLCGMGLVFLSISLVLLLHQLGLPVWGVLAIIGAVLSVCGFFLWRSSSKPSPSQKNAENQNSQSELNKTLEEVGTLVINEFLEGFKAQKKPFTDKPSHINNKI